MVLEEVTADEEAFMIKSINKQEINIILFLQTVVFKLKKFSE